MATATGLYAGSDSLDSFRLEAREWLAANFPPVLKGKEDAMSAIEGASEPSPDQAAWQTVIGEKGWGVPGWPKA